MAGRAAPISQRVRTALALLCVCAGCAAVAPVAYAAQKPVVSLTIPRAVSEGAAIPFSWTGRHLGRKHRLAIQRPVGTAHTWKTMMKLSSNSGSGELPGMALGKYRLRLADLSGGRVLATQVMGVGVFGQVPLSTLLAGKELESGVYTTPSTSFPFAFRGFAGPNATPDVAFTVEHNRCLSAHFGFVPGDAGQASYYKTNTVVGAVTLVQESRAPVRAAAAYNAIGSLDAELVFGQSWSLNMSYEGEFEPAMYINGYAICDSRESFFS